MRKLFAFGAALALAASAFAAPNVAQVTQKGSLLIAPDIRVDGPNSWDTLVRLQNDGNQDVDVKCYWMTGHKDRVDFIIPVTRTQAVYWDARTGNGTFNVNPFPKTPSNGFTNPTLGSDADYKGLLACWAVDIGGQNQVKWNHLSMTVTVYNPDEGAYEYNAYAFFVPTGLDMEAVGIGGTLELNSVLYDSCPLYQIGQFSPVGKAPKYPDHPVVEKNRLAIAGCNLQLQQDWEPVWTKLHFDVWNEEEVKFTGGFECADSWHETEFGDLDAASQVFDKWTLGTYAGRYRVQGIASSQCHDLYPDIPNPTEQVGIIAVQSSKLHLDDNSSYDWVGTTLTNAGKFSGKIVWDPQGDVPEGGIN